MNCTRSVELLSEFHAGELDVENAAGVSAHLAECIVCADVYADLTVIVEAAILLGRAKDDIIYPDEDALWSRVQLSQSATH